MRRAFEAAWTVMSAAIGLAVFLFVIWFAFRAHSRMWGQAARHYRARSGSASIARKLETVVIAERGVRMPAALLNPNYRNYPGLIMTIRSDGLALSLVPPFNIMCPPLFLPFDEMDLKPTAWALWPDPFAIRMKRVPDVDLIVARSTVGWIREHVDRSPFGLGV